MPAVPTSPIAATTGSSLVDIQCACPPVHNGQPMTTMQQDLFNTEFRPVMQALDTVRTALNHAQGLGCSQEMLATINAALTQVQGTITSTTKNALLAALPDYCAETTAYVNRIQEASTFVGGTGISVKEMKDAHDLNSAISRIHLY
jgi:hypothetical protein